MLVITPGAAWINHTFPHHACLFPGDLIKSQKRLAGGVFLPISTMPVIVPIQRSESISFVIPWKHKSLENGSPEAESHAG